MKQTIYNFQPITNQLENDFKGEIYEGLLEKNADSSLKGAGQYFTPRALISAMVDVIQPKPKQTIGDPACGTGGFLIESFNQMEKQVKGTKDNEFLQENCISGIEPRPDPYLFGLMNLMLHGIENPNIVRVNTLETKLSDCI